MQWSAATLILMQVILILSELACFYLNGKVPLNPKVSDELWNKSEALDQLTERGLKDKAFWDFDVFSTLAQTMLTGPGSS